MAEWKWPTPGNTRVTSSQGNRNLFGETAYHEGIDIAAPEGAPIVAACAGKVVQSGPAGGFGHWIVIEHTDEGLHSIYGHMYSHQLVARVGDIVNAGDLIAYVGSDGTSTGNHLHFQITQNGYAKGSRISLNPLDYVSPDGDTVVNIPPSQVSLNASSDSVDASYYRVIDGGGVTVGQRVAGITPQPIHPFVNIYLGSEMKLLATNPPKPNIIQSFEYDRMAGTGESATFTLYDDNWEEIEAALSSHFNDIYIEYGYYGTGMKSKIVKHLLLEYSISFESSGTLLSVSSVTEGAVKNLVQRNLFLNTWNPTEAVKKICTSLGYKVLDENFDSSKDITAENPFNLVADFPISYIQNVIIPQASEENEELFQFYIGEGDIAYFKRKSYDTTKTDTMRTYIYQKGYDSVVKDFTIGVKGVFGGSGTFNLATGYRTSVFDATSKSEEQAAASKAGVITTATGDTTHTNSNQSNVIIDGGGYSPSQVRNKLYYRMKSFLNDAYEATLTIVGDPTIQIHDFVRVINVTDKGYLHHSSGVYWISAIRDSVSGGEMTTVLTLIKNATAGDIDGVEIINPKLMIK